jgi:hypothetical protein
MAEVPAVCRSVSARNRAISAWSIWNALNFSAVASSLGHSAVGLSPVTASPAGEAGITAFSLGGAALAAAFISAWVGALMLR